MKKNRGQNHIETYSGNHEPNKEIRIDVKYQDVDVVIGSILV